MKDNGHTYLYCTIYFFGNKSSLGTPHFNSVREKLPSDFADISLTLKDSLKLNFGHVLALGFLPLGQGCPMASVLLSTSVERCFVSRMLDFSDLAAVP